ncbi:hypothetical protein NLI96_g11986 [Meripilus lineatus]|uniref:Cyclin N-terminal domain-containing protein n=1 Tax=Meripilus lineatus TaxID=2056292 RepID=A0AAD5YCU5_9APHY|nr:hypothetical protein NLI96_g11986 [Physisporinus lineatus]
MVASQQSRSPVHQASLIDPSLHSSAIMEMLEIEMSRPLIEYVVDCVVETVDYAMGRPSSSSRGRSFSRQNEHIKFTKFVADVLRKAEVKVPALLVTLVYIDRAKPHLQIALEQWACERVFLGALILANKYLNDSTLKNIHWALCTGVFGKRDIGRIEREFLDVLDFQLGITEDDILAHHAAIISITRPHLRITISEAPSVRSPLPLNTPPASPKSRWSSDSSDLDTLSSVESGSPPHTPAHPAMDVDTASVVPAPSKHTSEYLAVSSNSVPSPSKPAKESNPRRLSNAFQLLRAFPLPQFHSRQSSSAATSSSTLASSTLSSDMSLSIPSTGCKPVVSTHVAPRAASLLI